MLHRLDVSGQSVRVLWEPGYEAFDTSLTFSLEEDNGQPLRLSTAEHELLPAFVVDIDVRTSKPTKAVVSIRTPRIRGTLLLSDERKADGGSLYLYLLYDLVPRTCVREIPVNAPCKLRIVVIPHTGTPLNPILPVNGSLKALFVFRADDWQIMLDALALGMDLSPSRRNHLRIIHRFNLPIYLLPACIEHDGDALRVVAIGIQELMEKIGPRIVVIPKKSTLPSAIVEVIGRASNKSDIKVIEYGGGPALEIAKSIVHEVTGREPVSAGGVSASTVQDWMLAAVAAYYGGKNIQQSSTDQGPVTEDLRELVAKANNRLHSELNEYLKQGFDSYLENIENPLVDLLGHVRSEIERNLRLARTEVSHSIPISEYVEDGREPLNDWAYTPRSLVLAATDGECDISAFYAVAFALSRKKCLMTIPSPSERQKLLVDGAIRRTNDALVAGEALPEERIVEAAESSFGKLVDAETLKYIGKRFSSVTLFGPLQLIPESLRVRDDLLGNILAVGRIVDDEYSTSIPRILASLSDVEGLLRNVPNLGFIVVGDNDESMEEVVANLSLPLLATLSGAGFNIAMRGLLHVNNEDLHVDLGTRKYREKALSMLAENYVSPESVNAILQKRADKTNLLDILGRCGLVILVSHGSRRGQDTCLRASSSGSSRSRMYLCGADFKNAQLGSRPFLVILSCEAGHPLISNTNLAVEVIKAGGRGVIAPATVLRGDIAGEFIDEFPEYVDTLGHFVMGLRSEVWHQHTRTTEASLLLLYGDPDYPLSLKPSWTWVTAISKLNTASRAVERREHDQRIECLSLEITLSMLSRSASGIYAAQERTSNPMLDDYRKYLSAEGKMFMADFLRDWDLDLRKGHPSAPRDPSLLSASRRCYADASRMFRESDNISKAEKALASQLTTDAMARAYREEAQSQDFTTYKRWSPRAVAVYQGFAKAGHKYESAGDTYNAQRDFRTALKYLAVTSHQFVHARLGLLGITKERVARKVVDRFISEHGTTSAQRLADFSYALALIHPIDGKDDADIVRGILWDAVLAYGLLYEGVRRLYGAGTKRTKNFTDAIQISRPLEVLTKYYMCLLLYKGTGLRRSLQDAQEARSFDEIKSRLDLLAKENPAFRISYRGIPETLFKGLDRKHQGVATLLKTMKSGIRLDNLF